MAPIRPVVFKDANPNRRETLMLNAALNTLNAKSLIKQRYDNFIGGK